MMKIHEKYVRKKSCRTSVDRPAKTYIHLLFFADTGCTLEDILGAIEDKDRLRRRERKRERKKERERTPSSQCDLVMLIMMMVKFHLTLITFFFFLFRFSTADQILREILDVRK